MGDPADRVAAWLCAGVEPLPPPPGTFRRIRRRARRRKAARAVMTATSVVIVIAAAAAVPRYVFTLQHHGGHGPRPVAADRPSPPQPTSSSSGGSGSTRSSAPVTLPSSGLSPSGSGAPVPENFQPTSVTFVSTQIGAVIGQAGKPGHCGPPVATDCTSLAGTSDYGSTWYGLSAPVTGGPNGGQGVSQLRFLNTSDGWAFGPQLWVTHDGGATWTREQTGGMRVTGLETAGNRAFAVFARCTGTGPAYGANCTSVSLFTSGEGSDRWQPVSVPAGSMQPPAGPGPGAPVSAILVLAGGPAGGTGYLMTPAGKVLSGPLTGAPWTFAAGGLPAACAPGPPGPYGQPTGALLAAAATTLAVVCMHPATPMLVAESPDRGRSWAKAGGEHGPTTGLATSLAIQDQGSLILLATGTGLYQSVTSGSTWTLRQVSPVRAAASGPGFSYVGMTSPADGVALPADPNLHEVYITTDGGATWLPHAVSAP